MSDLHAHHGQQAEDNIMQALEEEGKGRVLVVDTGGSMRCAVLGDNLAAMGVKNGWNVCPACCL